MSTSSYREKNIACLETLWSDNLEGQLHMGNVLNIVSGLFDIKTSRLTCNTRAELAYNLDLVCRPNYRILYLACHGSPGSISLHSGDEVTLEELAEMMGENFKGWIVHFGSCGTIDVDHARKSRFMKATGVEAMIGYSSTIDWAESAAMDLLLFQGLQKYVRLKPLFNHINSRYEQLGETLGLTFVLR